MPATDIDIQTAGPDQADVLSELGNASFRAAYTGTCSDEDLESHLQEHFSVEVIRTEVSAPGRAYLMVTVAGQPGGYVKICHGEPFDRVPADNPIELRQVYVSPEQQRGGLGGLLIAAAAEFGLGISADGMWLSVWDEADWAIGCYRKNGFEAIGELDFWLGKTRYRDLLMYRSLL